MEERAKKNEVFRKPVEPLVPSVSTSDVVKADFGLDMPAERVPLPSNGVVYPASSPLHMQTELDITPMTAREEDILTSPALLKKGTVITELIRSCLVDKRINPVEMLSGDRNALMVSIRITGYGAQYDAEVTCSECDTKVKTDFDLMRLPIKRLELTPLVEGANLFEYVLPRTKKRVQFKFLAGTDEQEISVTQERAKKLGIKNDNNVTMNLMHSVVSVDGITDRQKIAMFIQSMPASDSADLRLYIRDHEPGITMKQEVTCENCDHTSQVVVPFGTSFFRCWSVR